MGSSGSGRTRPPSRRAPDARAYPVRLHSEGRGQHETTIRAEVSGSTIACLGARLKAPPAATQRDRDVALAALVESWLVECVERRASSHPNDLDKIQLLEAEQPLRFDSRYVPE